MKKIVLYPSLAIMSALVLTSCVSKKKHASLQRDYTEMGKKFHQTQLELTEARTRITSLESLLAAERANNESLKKQFESLQGVLDKSISQGNVNISKLVDEINSSNKYIKHLVEAKSKSDSLNMILTNNLTRSLSKDELKDVEIKVIKGVVYVSLEDNMLYKSGSYEISDKATQTLTKVAKIINDYKDFEVLVEGNTDNVPISRENIRNNWDLSALRASSVVQALQNKFGVDPKRLTAAGRGQFSPIASNDTESGRARNRRTQIIITPKLDQFMELIDQAPKN